MIKKSIITVIIYAIISVFLTGCWDRIELNDIGIVLAIGFDRDTQTGNILMTSQIVRPSALKKQGSTSKESPYALLTTSGATVLEASRNAVKEFDRRSYYHHANTVIIGESLAREGINDIIDALSRSRELKKSLSLLVTEDAEAREVIGLKHGLESIQANYLNSIIKRQTISLDTTTATMLDFIKKMPGEGINPVTGVIKVVNVESMPPQDIKPEMRPGLAITGTAVYSKDKLIGKLSNEGTLGFNLLTGKKKKAIVNVQSPTDDKKYISIEVQKVSNSIKPVIKDSKISFVLEVNAIGNITEVQDNEDLSDLQLFYKINEKFTEFIEEHINISVKKIQKDLKTDILGFGSEFHRKYPKEWKNVKNQWDDMFPTVSYEVKVKTSLKGTSQLLKPVGTKKD